MRDEVSSGEAGRARRRSTRDGWRRGRGHGGRLGGEGEELGVAAVVAGGGDEGAGGGEVVGGGGGVGGREGEVGVGEVRVRFVETEAAAGGEGEGFVEVAA